MSTKTTMKANKKAPQTIIPSPSLRPQRRLAPPQREDEVPTSRDRSSGDTFTEPGFGHNFGQVQVYYSAEVGQPVIKSCRLGDAPSNVHEVLSLSGQPLDPATRSIMESRFDEDFSQVRVHTDQDAHHAAQALDALAFTHSNQIFFESGAFSPNTSVGQHLLAHELVHVVQQSRQGDTLQSNHPSLETEADHAAASSVNSQGGFRIGLSSAPGIARQKKKPTIPEVEKSATSKFGGTPMTQPLKLVQLQHIMPQLKNAPNPQRYLDLTNQTFKLFQIDTVESRAFFLAQAKVETQGFRFLVEADIDDSRSFVERDEDIYENEPQFEPHYYTSGQLNEFGKRYLNQKSINVHAGKLPAGWQGRRTPNFAYVGRSPLQVTNKQNYQNAINTLRRLGTEWLKLERDGKAPHVAEDIALQGIPQGKSLGEKMIIAAERLSKDPALAADPDYGFLLSGAFLKMGRTTQHGETSMAKSASRWLQKTFSQNTFLGVGGPMFGRTLDQIRQFSENERKLTLKNLDDKIKAYVEIRDYLSRPS